MSVGHAVILSVDFQNFGIWSLLTKDTGHQTEEVAKAMTVRCEWRDACFRDLRDTHLLDFNLDETRTGLE